MPVLGRPQPSYLREVIMGDEVGYVERGLEGRTCSACKHYTPDENNSAVGKCMGHDVAASAGCNYFEPGADD